MMTAIYYHYVASARLRDSAVEALAADQVSKTVPPLEGALLAACGPVVAWWNVVRSGMCDAVRAHNKGEE